MDKVLVLMSTYNGEKYIQEQIDSILNQKNVLVNLLIRDDGSTDNTINIIKSYCKKYKNVNYYQGNNIKPAKSFFELVKNSDNSYEYYAFSDQDDLWLNNKLENAINKLKNTDNAGLYISSLIVTDENLNMIKKTKLKNKTNLSSSLISNIATGCTMVFNNKFKKLIMNNIPNNVIMHDWWIYCLAYTFNSFVYVDQESYIYYRQHASNVLGFESGLSKLKRRIKRFSKKTNDRQNQVKELLKLNNIPISNKVILKKFGDYNKSVTKKIKLLFSEKTGNVVTDILFVINVLFNRY